MMSYFCASTEEIVKACVESDNAEAWEEFIRRFRTLIGCVILRIARSYGEKSTAIIDDLIQETYLKVCTGGRRILRNFEPQHPEAFFGMLKATAVSVTHDYFRSRRAAKRGSGTPECQLPETDALMPSHPKGTFDIERDVLLKEIDVLLSGISSPTAARDRDIFWLYYRQGFTTKAIANIATYRLTTKGVDSILHRLTSYIRVHLASKGSKREVMEMRRIGVYSPAKESKGEVRS